MFDIFDALALIGGLCLFLFGMNVMGDGLERRAGNSLKALLGKLTDSKLKGFLTGMGVTAVIQSSSATTVMVVGFVNSKVMTLKQSIGVITHRARDRFLRYIFRKMSAYVFKCAFSGTFKQTSPMRELTPSKYIKTKWGNDCLRFKIFSNSIN